MLNLRMQYRLSVTRYKRQEPEDHATTAAGIEPERHGSSTWRRWSITVQRKEPGWAKAHTRFARAASRRRLYTKETVSVFAPVLVLALHSTPVYRAASAEGRW